MRSVSLYSDGCSLRAASSLSATLHHAKGAASSLSMSRLICDSSMDILLTALSKLSRTQKPRTHTGMMTTAMVKTYEAVKRVRTHHSKGGVSRERTRKPIDIKSGAAAHAARSRWRTMACFACWQSERR